jgi:ATP-binding cassette subfamily B protein
MPPKNNINKSYNKPVNVKLTLGKLGKYLKPYYLFLILAVVFSIGSMIIVIVGPEQIGRITDAVRSPIETWVKTNSTLDITQNPPAFITNWTNFSLGEESWNIINNVFTLLLVLYILSWVFRVVTGLLLTYITQKIAQKLRNELVEKINRLHIQYFDDNSYGDTLSIITNDVDNIGQMFNQVLEQLLTSATLVLGYIIMMFSIAWELALIAIASLPIMLLCMMFIMKKSQKYFLNNQRSLGYLNGHIEEIYSGLNIVHAFNAQDKFSKDFDKHNTDLANNGLKANFISNIIWPITNFISNISYIGVCILGGWQVYKGIRTFGKLQSMIIYSSNLNRPVAQVAQISTNIQMLLASSERIFNFLALEEMVAETIEEQIDPLKVQGKVEFINVKFGYSKDKEIIHDFSCIAYPGKKVAIVGPTGAGKTTLVNLLMRFYEINGGKILIDGIDYSKLSRENVHSLFAMVLQDTWLFKGTVEENLSFGRTDVSLEDIKKATKTAHVHHFIKSLSNGYSHILDEDSNISSGQKQLLTIARAMIANRPMLILDEATSNVDTRTEHLIQQSMDELMKGRTSFVIAHRLSTIKNSDLILVMDKGDIVESGSHDELLKLNGFYAKLYNSQFAGKSIDEAVNEGA